MRDDALWNGILIGFGVCCCLAAAMFCLVPHNEGVLYIIVTVGIISPAIGFAYEFYQRAKYSNKQ